MDVKHHFMRCLFPPNFFFAPDDGMKVWNKQTAENIDGACADLGVGMNMTRLGSSFKKIYRRECANKKWGSGKNAKLAYVHISNQKIVLWQEAGSERMTLLLRWPFSNMQNLA
ncbi:hypothetical protein F0562_027613 [Nyssa sinensis]|uniref:Uncharacterized protein n=1 Tax=Nyssa sinensis TaxID=561372 RepID=A0A5J5B7R2_9ASTE|nr:hypothetical protein F0562_027613 [Nyssa sinensis]